MILSLVLLAAVIATVHAEQRSDPSMAASSRRLPALGDVGDLDPLVDAPLPRAALGYEPMAVHARLVVMRQAYASLAAECEPAVVERAWIGVRGEQTPETRGPDRIVGANQIGGADQIGGAEEAGGADGASADAMSDDAGVQGAEGQGGARAHGR